MQHSYYIRYKCEGQAEIAQKLDIDGQLQVPERDQIIGLNGLRWKVLKVDTEKDTRIPRYMVHLGNLT